MVQTKMELILDEGKVFGARYYTVGMKTEFYFEPNNLWNDMMAWNVRTFGTSPREGVFEPNGRWYANNAKFWFRNEEDLTLFVLKWQ
jgi:hypothetical protein